MSGFYVTDPNGNLKLTTFGSGAALPDPVTVIHGGTGLTTVAQGDVLYASAAGVISRLAKDTGGLRILTNQGTSNNPTWTDPTTGLSLLPIPTTRKFAFMEAIGTATPATAIWAANSDGTLTSVVDATSTWIRHTTAAGPAAAGFRLNASWNWIDHNPTMKVYLRTGTDITSSRYWIIIANTSAAVSNADDQHLLKGVGIRYSAGTDTGWVTWKSDGTTQATGGVNLGTIAAGTVYAMTIKVNNAGADADITVGSTTQNVAIGAATLGTAMRNNIQVTTTVAGTRFIDIAAIYGEWS